MYSKLFTPVKVGNLEIKNRTVSTAMVMNFNTYDGKITDQFIKYLEEKAKGGYGLIITEDYSVNEHAKGFSRIAGLYNDEQIEGNRKLTDTIHKYGTKIFCQLYHPGRQTNHNVNGGVQPTAVSPIACPMCREMPRELTVEEIHQIVKEFGAAAGPRSPVSTASRSTLPTAISFRNFSLPTPTSGWTSTAAVLT